LYSNCNQKLKYLVLGDDEQARIDYSHLFPTKSGPFQHHQKTVQQLLGQTGQSDQVKICLFLNHVLVDTYFRFRLAFSFLLFINQFIYKPSDQFIYYRLEALFNSAMKVRFELELFDSRYSKIFSSSIYISCC